MNYADRLDFYLGTNFIAEKFDNIDFKKMRGIKRLNNNEKYGEAFKALLRKSNNHRKSLKSHLVTYPKNRTLSR